MNKQQQTLQNLESAFKQVIATQDPYWGVAAQYEIALAWEQFGDQYTNPPNIQGAKIADVKKQLKPLADQAYQKASSIYQNAHNDSKKFSIYSYHSRYIAEAIARRKGQKTTTVDWVITPDFIGSPASQEIMSHVNSTH